MPTPTFEQMKTWARRYVETWNAGDQNAWVENWKSIAPGEFHGLPCVGHAMYVPEIRGNSRELRVSVRD